MRKCSKTEGQSVTQRHDFQISIAQTVYGKHSPNQGSVAEHLKTFTQCLWQAFLPITGLLLLSISKTLNSDFFGDSLWVVSEFQRRLERFNSSVLTMSKDLNWKIPILEHEQLLLMPLWRKTPFTEIFDAAQSINQSERGNGKSWTKRDLLSISANHQMSTFDRAHVYPSSKVFPGKKQPICSWDQIYAHFHFSKYSFSFARCSF